VIVVFVEVQVLLLASNAMPATTQPKIALVTRM